MDIKVAFDHVLKKQLFIYIIELRIDNDLVTWKGSFLINQKIKLVIDEHDNKKKKIETGIS